MLFITVQLWCLSTVWALITPGPPCPVVEYVENFDFHKFTDKGLYEIGRYVEESLVDKDGDCAFGVYYLNNDTATLDITYVEDHHKQNSKWKVKYTPATKEIFYSNLNSGREDVFVHLYVVSRDNDKYYLLYSCNYDTSKKSRDEEFWILSPTKKLEDSVKNEIDNFLNYTHFIDKSKIFWDHEYCKIND